MKNREDQIRVNPINSIIPINLINSINQHPVSSIQYPANSIEKYVRLADEQKADFNCQLRSG